MLFRRSLTSASGKLRSTRASSVTSPLREKYPTPLLNRTTRVTGSDTAGLTSCLASPGAAPAPRSPSAPKPAAIPSTPATGATSSHFIDMAEPPQGSPEVGRGRSGVRPRLTPIIPDPLRPGPPGHPRSLHLPRGSVAAVAYLKRLASGSAAASQSRSNSEGLWLAAPGVSVGSAEAG